MAVEPQWQFPSRERSESWFQRLVGEGRKNPKQLAELRGLGSSSLWGLRCAPQPRGPLDSLKEQVLGAWQAWDALLPAARTASPRVVLCLTCASLTPKAERCQLLRPSQAALVTGAHL